MVERPERRRVARLFVPRSFNGFKLEPSPARLLDLSSLGARIEHPEHLHKGLLCYVDLPPALAQVRLTARVVWTQFCKWEQTSEGDTHPYYQSGLAFVGVTPEQQTALVAALEILKKANDTPEGESPR